MNRDEMFARALERKTPWDFIVIGGGATGMGVAVDAASRGCEVLLLEQSDFGKGTSSRSTKLVHGGVRYLEQGNIPLVREALVERAILRNNAPHLVSDLEFVVPNYAWWEAPFYGLGLKLYQTLSGKHGFGPSRLLSREETLCHLPNLETDGLRGGVLYHDGQFDDSRLLINLAATAVEHGGTVLNYTPVIAFNRNDAGQIDGVVARDVESGKEFSTRARIVINATGPFCDSTRRLADRTAAPLIALSQGAHLVLNRSFLPGNTAIMAPHTPDHRVMFAIPWHGHTLVGTTDTAIKEATLEPVPLQQEVDFILNTAGRYLHRKPQRADVLSQFAGIRPLMNNGNASNTAALSRGHSIQVDASGLLTISGGKWTTYRNMAEDCVNQAVQLAGLPKRPCITRTLRIHGYDLPTNEPRSLKTYGSDAGAIQELIQNSPALAEPLHPALQCCGAEVVWAVRREMARTVEDVLARRTRALFLNARAAIAAAPRVADLMAAELHHDTNWTAGQTAAFTAVAKGYVAY